MSTLYYLGLRGPLTGNDFANYNSKNSEIDIYPANSHDLCNDVYSDNNNNNNNNNNNSFIQVSPRNPIYFKNSFSDITLRVLARIATSAAIVLGTLAISFAIASVITAAIVPLAIAAGAVMGFGLVMMAIHYARVDQLNSNRSSSNSSFNNNTMQNVNDDDDDDDDDLVSI